MYTDIKKLIRLKTYLYLLLCIIHYSLSEANTPSFSEYVEVLICEIP